MELEQFQAVKLALRAHIEQVSIENIGDVYEALSKAKNEFKPIAEGAVEAAKSELVAAIEQLEKRLKKDHRGDELAQWRTDLMIDEIKEAIAKDPIDVSTLATAKGKLVGEAVGLERSECLAVRAKNNKLIYTAIFAANTKLQSQYEENVGLLEEKLHSALNSDSIDRASSLEAGRLLGWLDTSTTAPALVKGLRRKVLQSNLHASVSEHLISLAMQEDVTDEERVRENILGTSITGNATTSGELSAQLIPNAQRAHISIVLKGEAKSKNVGRNGPVTIYTSGTTSIDASKSVLIDAVGITSLPASASCDTNTTINSISAGPVAQNAARNRIRQQKRQAERIASQRAEKRVEKKVDDQANERLSEMKTNFTEKFRAPLIRLGEFPELMKLSTSDTSLVVEMLKANLYQMGATSAPPELTTGLDIGVQVHESMINNFAEALLGGKTLTDEKLAELAEQLTGEVPEELRITQDKDPWSITFPTLNPVTIEFNDSMLTVTIVGRRLSSGEQKVTRSMSITATYKIERQGVGTRLQRQADVEVKYVKGGSSVSDTAFKTTVRDRFRDVFKESSETEGLKLAGQLEKVGTLNLSQLDISNGWLVVGWAIPDKKVAINK